MINFKTANNGKKTKTLNNPTSTRSQLNILKFLSSFALVMLLGVNGVMGQNLTQSGFTGVIVPQYMGSGTNNRLPVMFRATVTGLTASTSYRYYTQAAISSDLGAGNSGAGNPILLNTAGTTYSTPSSPGLSTGGTYETFTTDASGNYTGWFGFVNTGNARFTTGNTIFPTITINAGGSSTTVGSRRALDLGITVFAYSVSAGATNGSFLNSASSGTAKNMVALYDNVTGTGRPVYVTYIENSGITNTTSGFTTYSTSAGNWGALIPNALTNGVRRIEQFSSSTGNAVNDNQDADGIWTTGSINTTTSTNGLTAKTISVTDAPLNVATTVVLSSPNPAVSAASLTANSTNNPIYRFDLAATNANATLSSLGVTTTGNYVSADVSNMKLWYQSSSTFNSGTATLLSTIATPGVAGSKTFSTFTRQIVASSSTGYFFITVDIASSITSPASTLGVSAVTTSNIGLTSSTSFTGTTNAGGTQTIGVSTAPTKLAITSITPTSPTAGSTFSVTVQSQDGSNVASGVTTSTGVTLSTNGNAGSIGGTTTGTISASGNSVTISGVTLSTAGTGVTLTATQTSGTPSLTAGTSSTFSVLAAASQLAFGASSPPSTGSVNTNLTSFTVEARRPNNTVDNSYTGNVTLTKASGSGNIAGTLTVAAIAGTATFSAVQFDAGGTYTITASSAALTTATSSNIVVSVTPVSIFTNPITGTNPNTSNPYITGQTINANITVGGISRGSGITGTTANDRYNATNWNTSSRDTADYFQFRITPSAGYKIDYSSFVYTGQASGTGPASFAFRSSIDSYGSDIGTPNQTGTTISLSAAAYQNRTVADTFRFYAWGGTGGTYSINANQE